MGIKKRTYFLNLRKKMACNFLQWRSYHLRGMLSNTAISFFISNQTRRCFQQLQSCVYKTIIYKHIPKSIQGIQFTHWNSRSGIPFVANIYSMLHVYGVVSYQTWHHLKTSENKFTTFDVNRPPYIRFASCLYEFMYQHISSLKSTPGPFNASLWSSHSGYNSTIPSSFILPRMSSDLHCYGR